MVGAVVARGDEVIAEGWHRVFGGSHAEVRALAGTADARGATLYTSLEPCAHRGKTPPCTEAVLDAGVARVVYWAADPGRRSGGGAAWLRERGVQVDGPHGEPAEWAAENPAFFLARSLDRPFVALKLAVSLDGRIAPAGGRRVWLTGPESRKEVHRLRAGFGAVMVGTGTWKADNPRLTARGPVVPRIPPLRVLLDRRGELAAQARALDDHGGAPTLVATAPSARRRLQERLAERAEVVAVPLAPAGPRGTVALDVAAVLRLLKRRAVQSVLCEGGGRLAASLLAAGLADRLYHFVAPALLGAGAVPAFPLNGRLPAGLLEGWKSRVAPVRCGNDTLVVLDRDG